MLRECVRMRQVECKTTREISIVRKRMTFRSGLNELNKYNEIRKTARIVINQAN